MIKYTGKELRNNKSLSEFLPKNDNTNQKHKSLKRKNELKK